MEEKEREEILAKEAQREEKIRRRMEREERRRQRKMSRKNAPDDEEMSRRIAVEERKLLVAQRKLESIRLLDELLERVKVNFCKICNICCKLARVVNDLEMVIGLQSRTFLKVGLECKKSHLKVKSFAS